MQNEKYSPIYLGSSHNLFHWRFGVPYHTRTGEQLVDDTTVDGTYYLVSKPGDPWHPNVSFKLLGRDHYAAESCPTIPDSFKVTVINYDRETDRSLEFAFDRLSYSKTTIVVGYNSEIEKLENLMAPRHLNLVQFHVIDDMATIDEFRRAVKRVSNNPGNHSVIFLGCLREAVGAAMQSVADIQNEHFIFIW